MANYIEFLNFIGKSSKSDRLQSLEEAVNTLWKDYCTWRANKLIDDDEAIKQRADLIIEIDCFPWPLLDEFMSAETAERYKIAMQRLREKLISDDDVRSFEANDNNDFQAAHNQLVIDLQNRHKKRKIRARTFYYLTALNIGFLAVYGLFNLFTDGVYFDKIEVVTPYHAYDLTETHQLIPKEDYRKRFLNTFSDYYFWDYLAQYALSKPNNDFEALFFTPLATEQTQQKYHHRLGLKLILRNNSFGKPLFISSVGVKIRFKDKISFPWQTINLDKLPASKISVNNEMATALQFENNGGAALNFSAFLLSDEYLPLSNAVFEPIVYRYDYLENGPKVEISLLEVFDTLSGTKLKQFKPKEFFPILRVLRSDEPDLPLIDLNDDEKVSSKMIDCQKPLFGISDPYRFLSDLNNDVRTAYDDLFETPLEEYISDNDDIQPAGRTLSEFLPAIRKHRFAYKVFTNCFYHELADRIEPIWTTKRLAEVTTVKMFPKLIALYAYYELSGERQTYDWILDSPFWFYQLSSALLNYDQFAERYPRQYEYVAKITSVTGQVLVNRGEDYIVAESGMELNVDDRVIPMDNATVTIFYPESHDLSFVEANKGCEVRLPENSQMVVESEEDCIMGASSTKEGGAVIAPLMHAAAAMLSGKSAESQLKGVDLIEQTAKFELDKVDLLPGQELLTIAEPNQFLNAAGLLLINTHLECTPRNGVYEITTYVNDAESHRFEIETLIPDDLAFAIPEDLNRIGWCRDQQLTGWVRCDRLGSEQSNWDCREEQALQGSSEDNK